MLDAEQIHKKLLVLKRRHSATDQRWADVHAARRGDLDLVVPDMISEDFPKQIVANFVDTVARDLAEVFAPLPSFNCSSATMASDNARKFADKRTKIVQWYADHSRLAEQALYGADHWVTYARQVYYLEPDFEARVPRITIEDPRGGYAEFDRWNRVLTYTKRWYCDAEVLANLYPEYAAVIRKQAHSTPQTGETQIELVRYCDADQIALVLIGQHPIMLEDVENPLGECPIVIQRKPWVDEHMPKGQFDDVIWCQIARDVLAKLQLSAVEKQVQAPLALPNDVQELPYGPDAIIRTNTPEKVQRVGLEMGNTAFAQQELMMQEMQRGARYSEARSGGIDASIITGKGVQALMGAFDTQIKTYQVASQVAFENVVRLCFKMDSVYWPDVERTIRGQSHGAPYKVTYKPTKDIQGDFSCNVSYGFATGLDPNRAVVMMLQLRAEKVFSRDYFARQLPFDFDVTSELAKVQVEDSREALLQSIYALAQAIPALAQSGMDPAPVVHQMSMVIQGLPKGRAVEEVVAEVFAPPEPAPAPGGAPGSEAPVEGGLGASGGLTPSGLMTGVPAGQAGMAPGGRPDLSVMLAGLTAGGNPQMSASTMRRRRF
jgi:hypothetical protein